MNQRNLLATTTALLLVISLALAGCYPEEWAAVSPDGKALIVSHVRAGVFWIALDGSSVKRLAPAAGWNPQFSPDGHYCAFMSFDPEGEERVDLLLYDLTTDTSKTLRTWRKTQEEPAIPYLLPSWRPGGTELAYVLWYIGEPNQGEEEMTTELHILDMKSQENRKVAENVGIHCSWSPDGKRLAFYQQEEGPLGSLRILEAGETASVAGLLLDPYADITWLSNDRILFVSPKISLPTSEREKNDVQEAVFVFDLVTRAVAPLYETAGLSWRALSSCLRLSPDRRRVLFGTHEASGDAAPLGLSGTVSLWCYDLAASRRTWLADGIHDTYPFWVDDSQVGYFEDENTIVIATLDSNSKITSRRTLDLEELLAPLKPEAERASEPSARPSEAQ